MKKNISSVFVIILFFVFMVNAGAKDLTYNWFCVHRKDHLQPKADQTIAFVEEYDGYYIDKKHGDNCADKVVYLTFDAGYENGNVKRVLDVLNEENVTGAFFILGHLLEDESELVDEMHNSGHLVCNHSFSHRSMVGISKEEFTDEIKKLEDIYREKTGNELSKFYRPPEGKFDRTSLKYAQELGYKTVFWSFAYADWDNNAQMSPEKAKKKILENVHNGEIMLLHPTSETNAQILSEIIRELKSQGYRFGSLDEL